MIGFFEAVILCIGLVVILLAWLLWKGLEVVEQNLKDGE